MCNAWNHPPDCTCGWGGDGHLGSSNNHLQAASIIAIPISTGHNWRFSLIRSSDYTVPNAICPICGELVFFYSSPDGGRVFFDELGPPWPKHPCTDLNGTIYSPSPTPEPLSFKWQTEGWIPLKISSVARHNQELLIIDGEINNSTIIFYIHNPINRYVRRPPPPLKGHLTLARWITSSKLEISLLSEKGSEALLQASTISFDARDLPPYV